RAEERTWAANLGMGLPARQRRFEADAQERAHVARLAEEQRRAEQQPELHAVRIAELESRKHGDGTPRRPLRKGGAGPEVGGALDREVDADLGLARLRPPFQPSTAPTRARGRSGGPAVGRLKFELDEQRRWSIWYYGDGQPVPLIQTAVVGARVGDQLVTLADLEDSTVGNRRPPGGESVVVRG